MYEALTTNPNHIASLEGHTTNVTAVAFQHQSKWLVSGSEDGTLKLWDLRARMSTMCDSAGACTSVPVL